LLKNVRTGRYTERFASVILAVRLTDFLLFLHVAEEGDEWPCKDHHRTHENAKDGGDWRDKERPDAIPKRRTIRGWTTAASGVV
jgi:hypothetical protein